MSDITDMPAPAAERLKEEDIIRCRAVEEALFRRACGYVQPLKKSMKVKRIEYDADTGKKISEREELETGVEEEHIPADLRVCAYYLNNRDPARWRDHPDALTNELGGIVAYPATVKPTCEPPDDSDLGEEREA